MQFSFIFAIPFWFIDKTEPTIDTKCDPVSNYILVRIHHAIIVASRLRTCSATLCHDSLAMIANNDFAFYWGCSSDDVFTSMPMHTTIPHQTWMKNVCAVKGRHLSWNCHVFVVWRIVVWRARALLPSANICSRCETKRTHTCTHTRQIHCEMQCLNFVPKETRRHGFSLLQLHSLQWQFFSGGDNKVNLICNGCAVHTFLMQFSSEFFIRWLRHYFFVISHQAANILWSTRLTFSSRQANGNNGNNARNLTPHLNHFARFAIRIGVREAGASRLNLTKSIFSGELMKRSHCRSTLLENLNKILCNIRFTATPALCFSPFDTTVNSVIPKRSYATMSFL